MDPDPNDQVIEEIQRTCQGTGVSGTDVEEAAKTLYGTYQVQKDRRKFAVACVAIAMQEYNNGIPLDFIVTASSVDDVSEVRLLKRHIENTLGLTYQQDPDKD